MRKIFYLFFSLFLSFFFSFSLFTVSANAQYTEYFKFHDVRHTLVYDMIFADLIYNDAQILSGNKVKEVTLRGEDGAVLNKFTLNPEGWIIQYSTYEYNENQEIKYDITWDEDNKPMRIDYKETGRYEMNIAYVFHYNENFIDFISADFGYGLKEDYVITPIQIDKQPLVKKIAYDDKSKDTVYMVCTFEYDKSGRLTGTYVGQSGRAIDTISYEDNSVLIDFVHYEKKKYIMENLRITEEQTTIPPPQTHAYVKPELQEKETVVAKKYFYKENGLIDYTEINGNPGSRIKYEYVFY